MNATPQKYTTDWKLKLLAYLHDPPHKPKGIKDHEDQRKSFLLRFGLTDDDDDTAHLKRTSDWQAAAADRLIFPDPKKSGLRVDWEESWLEFRHPLGGGQLHPKNFPPTAAQLEKELTHALEASAIPDSTDWKRFFIIAWRLWPELAARERNPHLAYLVADTRIPDHTLWHHNSLAAAFATCHDQPAFLLFQIGPVQDFIAQARKTQDLWSGSYLLSFLTAQAILAVADGFTLPDGQFIDGVGPDCIIFPQVRSLPLADHHWHKQHYTGNLELRASHPNELLSPNIPNRFLALVPADRAHELARAAEHAVKTTWREIANSVRTFIDEQLNGQCPDWAKFWDEQIQRFPVIDWVAHKWSDSRTAISLAKANVPPLPGGWENHPLNHTYIWAHQCIPQQHKESFGPESNSAFAWALHFAMTEWKLHAHKKARAFRQWAEPTTWQNRRVPKDHLDGKNEVLGGADHERFWTILRNHPLLGEKTTDHPDAERHFTGAQCYGALSVVKRLWLRTYLSARKDSNSGFFDFDAASEARKNFRSVVEISSGRSDPIFHGESDEVIEKLKPEESYYAVLVMDGDDMGQWLSGAKAAPLINSLANEAADYFKKHWPNKNGGLPAADKVTRPISPGYHAALADALSTFSLYCAGPIVRAFGGQLIYCGGDDLLALLPARTAIECAHALQLAFRGIDPQSPDAHASPTVKKVLLGLFEFPAPGFVLCKTDAGSKSSLKPNWPLLVMGPLATVSAGIAIGHVRSPMQDIIEAAREAENTAKSLEGKGAFCITVLKRSGEAVSFSARFRDNIISVWNELETGVYGLSSRFPHRYGELVKALVVTGHHPTDTSNVSSSHKTLKGSKPQTKPSPSDFTGYVPSWDDILKESIQTELRHVLHHQGNMNISEASEVAKRWIGALTSALTPRDFLHFWLVWAFVSKLVKPQRNSQP
ncbi:MAG: type III-B CRISPR-associated protein Cas10/Cmr2 [Verrucomicrobiae bacterium]|nr:type III-B CRISPR-associated protein Cas10/Cmr2 [Verrucomicrobiae bacterium]